MERGRAVAKSFTRAYQCTRFGGYPVQHFCVGEHQRSMKAAVARGGQLEGRLVVRSKLGPASPRDLARSTVFASLWPFCALARIRIKWVAFLTSKIVAAKKKQVNSLVQFFRSDLESESQSKRKLLGSSSISLSFEITTLNPFVEIPVRSPFIIHRWKSDLVFDLESHGRRTRCTLLQLLFNKGQQQFCAHFPR